MSNLPEETAHIPANPRVEDAPTEHRRNETLLRRVPPRPAISTPDNLSTHPAGTHVLIKGTCQRGAKVELFTSSHSILGEAVVVDNQWFFYRVWGEETNYLSFDGKWLGWIGSGAGRMNVYAVQTVDNMPSEPSAPRVFTVGQLIKSPVPVLHSPVDGAVIPVPAYLTIFGSCEVGAAVEIMFDGEWEGYSFPENGGAFFHHFPTSVARTRTYQVRQTAPGFLVSDPGPVVTIRTVDPSDTVEGFPHSVICSEGTSAIRRPSPPTIELPDQIKIGNDYVIKGSCDEGAIVELKINDDPPNVMKVIDKTWYGSRYINIWGPAKSETYSVRQSVGGSEFSDWSSPATVIFDLAPPKILSHDNGQDHFPSGLFMSGVCDQKAVVEILSADDGSLIGNAIVKGTTWVYFRQWEKGSHRVVFRQTYLDYVPRNSEPFTFNIL
jgi:hypothetical protein